MIIKKISTYIGLILFLFVLNACQNIKKYDKPFKHNTPLIKDKDIVSSGKSVTGSRLDNAGLGGITFNILPSRSKNAL